MDTKIISVINWKGGVGKTTLSHHLACGLQEIPLKELKKFIEIETYPKVLLIDADAQCNLSIACLSDDAFEKMVYKDKIDTIKDLFEEFLVDEDTPLDVDNFIIKKSVRSSRDRVYTYIDLIPSHPDLIYTDMNIAVYSRPNFRAKLIASDIYKFQIIDNLLNRVKENYDFIIIDCPPNLNFITQNALYASDLYLIPTILDKLSSYGILSITNKVKELNNTFAPVSAIYKETSLAGIVANNVREYAEEPKKSQANVLSTLQEIFNDRVFDNYLTYGDGVARASALGYPVFAIEDENANASKQSNLIREIIKEFLGKL